MKTSPEKQYLKKLKCEIGKLNDEKIVMISEFSADLHEYLSKNDDATFDDICNEFKSPEELARDLLNREDVDCLKKKAKRYKIWRIFAVVAVVIAIALLLLFIKLIDDGAIFGKTVVTSDGIINQ